MPTFLSVYNLPAMELRHLQAFVAVADELSFTKAAQRLHISQPPLSRQIFQLEQELGLKLFVRHQQGATLTDDGQLLLERARFILAQARHLLEVPHHVRNGAQAGVIRLGVGARMLPLLNRVRLRHASRCPSVIIEPQPLLSYQQIDAIRRGAIDVGFLRLPIDDQHLQSEVLFEEHFLVLVASNHPLASQRAVRLRDLASDTLAVCECSGQCSGRNYLTKKILSLSGAAKAPLRIRPVSAPPWVEPCIMMGITGCNVPYLDMASPLTPVVFETGITALQLQEPNAVIQVHMAWRKNNTTPILRQFLTSVRDALQPDAAVPARPAGRRQAPAAPR